MGVKSFCFQIKSPWYSKPGDARWFVTVGEVKSLPRKDDKPLYSGHDEPLKTLLQEAFRAIEKRWPGTCDKQARRFRNHAYRRAVEWLRDPDRTNDGDFQVPFWAPEGGQRAVKWWGYVSFHVKGKPPWVTVRGYPKLRSLWLDWNAWRRGST